MSARLCAAGLGTDTGGSVRIPSALCGCVGIKPSLGRVSTAGMMGLSWTCDVSGPIARSVADAAQLLQVMCDLDNASRPNNSLELLLDLVDDVGALQGLKIGLARGFFATDNDPCVDTCVAEVAAILSEHGAEVVEITIPDIELAVPAGFAIVVPESISLTEAYWQRVDPTLRIDEQLSNFGDDVRTVFAGERGADARPIAAHSYLDALRNQRPKICRGFENALSKVDLLLTPATPCPAVPITQDVEMLLNDAPVDTFSTFIRYTFGVSLAGLPAITVPGGQSTNGLPIGVQFIGQPWGELQLIKAAWAYEVAVSNY